MIRTALVLLSAEIIKVVDEAGRPVDKFEAMYHTAEQGYSHWEPGRDGQCQLHMIMRRNPVVVDVLVRADGYATAVKRFTVEEVKKYPPDGATIPLVKGQRVKVRLQLPEGTELPADFTPETYYPQFAERVRTMWQPDNQRGQRRSFNLLNLRPAEDGTFSLTTTLRRSLPPAQAASAASLCQLGH